MLVEISREEAATLVAVMMRVGGDYYKSRRRHTDDFSSRIREKFGPLPIVSDNEFLSNCRENTIYFKNMKYVEVENLLLSKGVSSDVVEAVTSLLEKNDENSETN